MTLAQTLIKALMDTLMGMGSVFLILILISLIISLFKYMNKEKPASKEPVPAVQTVPQEEDDGELIAVIMTAVRMAMAADGGVDGASKDIGYVVRSVKRRR